MIAAYLLQLFHVGRFDVDNIERLIGDLHVPQVDSKISEEEQVN